MKIKLLPILFNISSKIDLKDLIDNLEKLDIFDENQTSITKEQEMQIGLEVISCILPQLGNISDDIIPLVCALKDVDEKTAEEMDIVEVFKEVFSNSKITGFLSKALQKKVEQQY